jgi:hypothetical protein
MFKLVFYIFGRLLGLKVNIQKSELLITTMSMHQVQPIGKYNPMQTDSFFPEILGLSSI